MTEMEEIKTMLADMNKKLDKVIFQNKIALNTKYGSPITQETEELRYKKLRKVKHEAVKEFAEKLKAMYSDYLYDTNFDGKNDFDIHIGELSRMIDELLKEYEK